MTKETVSKICARVIAALPNEYAFTIQWTAPQCSWLMNVSRRCGKDTFYNPYYFWEELSDSEVDDYIKESITLIEGLRLK